MAREFPRRGKRDRSFPQGLQVARHLGWQSPDSQFQPRLPIQLRADRHTSLDDSASRREKEAEVPPRIPPGESALSSSGLPVHPRQPRTLHPAPAAPRVRGWHEAGDSVPWRILWLLQFQRAGHCTIRDLVPRRVHREGRMSPRHPVAPRIVPKSRIAHGGYAFQREPPVFL